MQPQAVKGNLPLAVDVLHITFMLMNNVTRQQYYSASTTFYNQRNCRFSPSFEYNSVCLVAE